MKRKCVFFDRDGVVNRSPGPGYVERWQDFHLQPDFVVAAKVAASSGYAVAIATNQRCVALGRVSHDTLDDMHARLRATLSAVGVSLLGIFCCTHERDSCDCRKPLPGLLLQAAEDYDVDLAHSWMVGDNETDVEAGRNAGCRTVLIGHPDKESKADIRVAEISELAVALQSALT